MVIAAFYVCFIAVSITPVNNRRNDRSFSNEDRGVKALEPTVLGARLEAKRYWKLHMLPSATHTSFRHVLAAEMQYDTLCLLRSRCEDVIGVQPDIK